MTTFVSAEQTLADSTTPSDRPDANLYGGKVRSFTATLDLAANTVVANDLIKLFRLPVGFVPIQTVIHSGALGATTTVAIGPTTDADAYRTAALKNVVTGDITANGDGFGAALAADEDVYATVAAGVLPTTGELIIQIVGSQGN